MRIQKIVCDRCGKEITGYPVEIFPQYVDREHGEEIWPDNDDPLPDRAESMIEKEFCVECTKRIVRFALGGLKVNAEFEQAVQEMVKDVTPPDRTENDDVSDKDTGKQEKSRRNKIDTGKVMALTNAGWSAAKIADEMGISTQAVYDVRYRSKKEG